MHDAQHQHVASCMASHSLTKLHYIYKNLLTSLYKAHRCQNHKAALRRGQDSPLYPRLSPTWIIRALSGTPDII
jgi:hypothetical protein